MPRRYAAATLAAQSQSCSKDRLEHPRLGKGDITPRQRQPFRWLTRLWLKEMSKRKTRASAGSIHPVKLKETWGNYVIKALRASLDKTFADPTSAEQLAFQGENVNSSKGSTKRSSRLNSRQSKADDRRVREAGSVLAASHRVLQQHGHASLGPRAEPHPRCHVARDRAQP